MTYETPRIPKMTPWLLWGFQGYVTRYLRKHFNAVRLTRNSVPDLEAAEPVIIFGNHPGWWDPLMACFLNRRLFHPRRGYSPIDGEALAHYPIFGRLGYYGIQMDSLQGAKQFLATSRAILHQPDSALWITPGGQFC
ncbi:MAG: lysophospholipid acyltransferase family protein, partial [Planctomycetota bacterium]